MSYNYIKYFRLRFITFLIITTLVLILFFILEVALGPGSTQGFRAITILISNIMGHSYGEDIEVRIVLDYRLPRALLGLALGMVLSLGGVLLQSALRNPLAEPYLLGIAGGAAFGAILSYIFLPSIIGIYLGPLIAAIMGMLALGITLGIARAAGFTATTIILAGISTSTMFSAVNAILLLYFYEKVRGAHFWFFGTLSTSTWIYAKIAIIIAIVLLLISMFLVRLMNSLILGDEIAKTLGIEPSRARLILLSLAATSSSILIAFTGPIGFIGLIAPHIARLLVGHDHRALIPLSALIGASLILSADLFARLGVRPSELPLGAITAAFGVPFFLYLLIKSRGKYGF